MKALQASLDRKQILVLDALRYSLMHERDVFRAVTRFLRRIGKMPFNSRPPDRLAIGALASAWQLIDNIYRIRGLLRQVKGLSQKSPQIQLFLRNTAGVDNFRNFFQHLDSSIAKLSGKSYPIMGVLSWVTHDPAMSCSLSLGHWTKDTHAHSLVVDTWTSSFVARIQLDAGNASIELANAHSSARKLSAFLERWLRTKNMLRDTELAASVMRFGIGLRAGA